MLTGQTNFSHASFLTSQNIGNTYFEDITSYAQNVLLKSINVCDLHFHRQWAQTAFYST